jgi:hypothetical protein
MSSPSRCAGAREAHRCGDEAAWWKKAGIDPSLCARALWLETHPLPTTSDKMGSDGSTSLAPVGTVRVPPSVIGGSVTEARMTKPRASRRAANDFRSTDRGQPSQ